MMFATM